MSDYEHDPCPRFSEEDLRDLARALARALCDNGSRVPIDDVLAEFGYTRSVAFVERREPVPDWLADRLIHTVGMTREEVASLDLEKAVDLWADHRSRPH